MTLLFALLVGFTTFQCSYIWTESFGMRWMMAFAHSDIIRPYVYRALLPLLAQAAERAMGIPAITGVVVLVVISGVGFFFALRSLLLAYMDRRTDLLAFLGAELFFLLILAAPQPYDIATAFLFTLAYLFLVRGQWGLYLALFPVATLNRETTFLLILVWAVWGFFRLSPGRYIAMGLYQVIVWIGIRALILAAFAGHRGVVANWALPKNLSNFAAHPLWTGIVVCLFVAVVWLVARRWKQKPAFLRTAFVAIFPLQVLFYVLLGGAFELRVFAESFPVLYLLAVWPVVRIPSPVAHSWRLQDPLYRPRHNS